jgi:hypothetical protein
MDRKERTHEVRNTNTYLQNCKGISISISDIIMEVDLKETGFEIVD